MRYLSWIAGWTAFWAAGSLWAVPADEIITEAAAQRCGLTRAWVTQAQVDAGRGRLQDLVLYDGTLFAQSSRATLEAIDAETGQRLWSKMVGRPKYPSLVPGACKDLVAVMNGSQLFVLNRYNGDILFDTNVEGVPGSGPALSAKRAYVPTVSGIVYSYRLDPIADPAKELGKINPNWVKMSEDEKKEALKQAEEERRENLRLHQEYAPPLACYSDGRAITPAVLTTQTRDEEFVTWVTDKGHLHLGRVDRRSPDALTIRFRVNVKAGFNNPPAYMPPNPKVAGDTGTIFAGSNDGELVAISEFDGSTRWKFSIGDPIVDSPVVINDRLYVVSELGGLFALTAKTGKQLWFAPEIIHFVAAGRQRVYATDKLGRLRILDTRTGAVVDVLPTGGLPIRVCNNQTDRIYLATESGMVQCLHEVEESKPIFYNQGGKPLAEEEEPSAKAPPKPKSNTGAAAKPKPSTPKPPPKKAASKAAGGGDSADQPSDDDQAAPKPARGKAPARGRAKAAKAAAADADAAPGP